MAMGVVTIVVSGDNVQYGQVFQSETINKAEVMTAVVLWSADSKR